MKEIFSSCKWKVNVAHGSKGGFTLAWPCEFFSSSCKPHNCQIKCGCWGPWGSMWRWSLANRKMPHYIACSMFRIAKIHQAFLCYKDNCQINFYWCPCHDLLRVLVLVIWCTFKVMRVLVLCRWYESLHWWYKAQVCIEHTNYSKNLVDSN
jgi:hypothetical protein